MDPSAACSLLCVIRPAMPSFGSSLVSYGHFSISNAVSISFCVSTHKIGIFQCIPVNNPVFGLELALEMLSPYFQSLSGGSGLVLAVRAVAVLITSCVSVGQQLCVYNSGFGLSVHIGFSRSWII